MELGPSLNLSMRLTKEKKSSLEQPLLSRFIKKKITTTKVKHSGIINR